MNARKVWLVLIAVLLAAAVFSMTACGSTAGGLGGDPGAVNCGSCGNTGGGGGGGIGTATSGSLTVTLLDPPTCASPRTNITHLYLTVAGLQLNPDGAATADSTGWVDVSSTLATAPKQVDMFNLGTTVGNLLSSTVSQGTYKSVRLLLAANSSAVSGNQCGSAGVNCVSAGTSMLPIYVATETTRGIVVNSSGISGGDLTVGASGSNINLLFNSCSSLIPYQGGYRLLPSMYAWAGGIQTYSVTLSDFVTQARIGTGQTIVALEQSNTAGYDQIISEASADGSGAATLYAPSGTFDFVAVAKGTSGAATTLYSPLAITGVTGAATAPITVPMFLQPQGTVSPAQISQTVESGVPIDTRLSVQQTATINGTQTQPFTIPLMNTLAATLPTETTVSSTCTTGACGSSTLEVPALPLYVQTYGSSASNASSSAPAYTVTADAFRSQYAGVQNCSTSSLQTSSSSTGGTLSPAAGQTLPAATLTFTGCQ